MANSRRRKKPGIANFKQWMLDHPKEEFLRSKRISLAKMNEGNAIWKGDAVGYAALHGWVKRRLKRPKRCGRCSKTGRIDLANKSQKYLRDLSDWEWLCRRCHMETDGRLKKLISYSKKKRLKDVRCPSCKKMFYPKNKPGCGKARKFCSWECYVKLRRGKAC